MPLKEGTTAAEAREVLAVFLKDSGCYNICAQCPVYPGGEGCCHGCANLARGEGCTTPNLSCLSYTCGVLNEHLRRQDAYQRGLFPNALEELTELIYGLPREGYRGCQRREDGEMLQIADPLAEIVAEIDIPSDSMKEESANE